MNHFVRSLNTDTAQTEPRQSGDNNNNNVALGQQSTQYVVAPAPHLQTPPSTQFVTGHGQNLEPLQFLAVQSQTVPFS